MSNAYPQPPAPSPQPPSRRDNPFATCWTKPGAIAFRFTDGQDAEQLVAMLASQDWWGAIEGPHGSGKSTLLESLKPALAAAGRHVITLAIHDGERRLPASFWSQFNIECKRVGWVESARLTTVLRNLVGLVRRPTLQPSPQESLLVVIDGYEQLSWLERLRLARRCRRRGAGLLLTTHSTTPIRTLIRLAPSRELVSQLVAELCTEVSTSIAQKDVAASHACHGSNVREIFFDLYDRHEARRGATRTQTSAAT